MDTYSYTPDTDSYTLLPTCIHTHTCDFNISRFLCSWNFHISANQEIWKSTKLKSWMFVGRCMYVYLYACVHVCVSVCSWILSRPSLKHRYFLKGQQGYNIINICVFFNTIQKEMDLEKIYLLNHHYPLKGQQAYSTINICICEHSSEKRWRWIQRWIWSRSPSTT